MLFDKNPAAVELLVTDIKMPGMSGTELAAYCALKRPDLPVLFMSGWVDAIVAPDLHGPQRNMLAKPFEADVLLDAAQALLSTTRR